MAKTTRSNSEAPKKASTDFVFDKSNYLWMIIGLVVIVLGFVLMVGADGDIYDRRRITIAPVVVLLGFAIEIYAIMKKPSV